MRTSDDYCSGSKEQQKICERDFSFAKSVEKGDMAASIPIDDDTAREENIRKDKSVFRWNDYNNGGSRERRRLLGRVAIPLRYFS